MWPGLLVSSKMWQNHTLVITRVLAAFLTFAASLRDTDRRWVRDFNLFLMPSETGDLWAEEIPRCRESVSQLSRPVSTFQLDNRPGAIVRRADQSGQWRHAGKYRARTENCGSLSPGVGPGREKCEAPCDCRASSAISCRELTNSRHSLTSHRVQVNNFTSWSS